MTTKSKNATSGTRAREGQKDRPGAKRRHRKAKANAAAKPSALTAAHQILARCGKAMRCAELIGAMASAGLWTSPAGQTPAATLYAAIAREITTKGDASRFVKIGPGHFAAKS
jgi:hypothetical protein